jgi:hypothetical protein
MPRITHPTTPAGEPDVPTPDLQQLQQRDEDPAVPVRTAGPVETHELPSRSAQPSSMTLTTTMQHVLGADLKRKRATLVADDDWRYSTTRSGPGVRWPADVPLLIEHADAVYAKVSADTAELSVISETWAD